MFAITSSASATTVTIGNYVYATTDEFCKLDLTPETATLPTGTQHTVTATVSPTGLAPVAVATREATFDDVIDACVLGDIEALADVGVNFTVTSGPNAGKTGIGMLDTSGKAFFSYVGMSAGTDTIEASLTLPDVCVPIDYIGPLGQQPRAADVPVPLACEGIITDIIDELPTTDQLNPECGPQQAIVETPPECPTATLTDTATVTWTPPPQVTQAAAPDPSVSISSRKRCVAGKFHISPSYSNGTVKTSTLFIDSRKVSTKTSTSPFTINAKRYKPGKHNVEVVTVFTDGKAASKFASFSRCKVRTAARKVAPRFTG